MTTKTNNVLTPEHFMEQACRTAQMLMETAKAQGVFDREPEDIYYTLILGSIVNGFKSAAVLQTRGCDLSLIAKLTGEEADAIGRAMVGTQDEMWGGE